MTEPLNMAATTMPDLAAKPMLMVARAPLKTAGRVRRAIGFFGHAVKPAHNLQAGV